MKIWTTVVMAALVAGSLTACGKNYDYNAICADRERLLRVEDDGCDAADDDYRPTHAWYYLKAARDLPDHGDRVSGGSFAKPEGSIRYAEEAEEDTKKPRKRKTRRR